MLQRGNTIMTIPEDGEKDKIDGAVSALHQISGLAGVNTEKRHEKWKKSRDPDVEKGRAEKRAEIRRILEQSLAESPKTNGEVVGDEEVPSLNRDQAQVILDDLERKEDEADKGNKPSLCPLVCHVLVLPFIVLLIWFGYTNRENCPLTKLPMWIMWLGIFWVIRIAPPFVTYFTWHVKSLRGKLPMSSIESACRTFIISWAFYGMYLMQGNWSDHNEKDPTHPRYCEPSVMLYSKILLVLINVCWILTIVWDFCCCIVDLTKDDQRT